MQKYLLKQQFEGFSVSASEGLHKGYDRFQTLLSQLEIHGAGVSYEDANQKFLRSLPSFWSQVALIIRTKPGLDTLSFNDLYNNLRVFEHDVKGTTASSSSDTQNVTFVSADNTRSTNDVSTAYSVSSPSVSKSQKERYASYTDEVIHSFFSNQSSAPQLDCDDLEQINDDDLEEMDLKWQVAMISMRIKKFYKKTDGEVVKWSGHVEKDTQNFAMMAYSFSNSGSDNEVKSYSKKCAESYARLKKLYDEQRDKLGDASVEITTYTLALKKVEAQLLYQPANFHQFMSSPTHPTPSNVDEEYAFPSTNILNYTSTLPNYFLATLGNISSDFLENSKNNEIPPVLSHFYINPYLKDMQAFYANESPIPPPDPITLPAILTPSSVLPPSPLFDP
nr:hypothetical protein [Tanacetum cinerariifolium]